MTMSIIEDIETHMIRLLWDTRVFKQFDAKDLQLL